MFYGFILIIGIIAFILPIYVNVSNYSDILMGFGIAFMASSILGFAQRLFFYDDFAGEMNSLVESALHGYLTNKMFPFMEHGIEQLFLDRKAAIREFSKYIQSENRHDRSDVVRHGQRSTPRRDAVGWPGSTHRTDPE